MELRILTVLIISILLTGSTDLFAQKDTTKHQVNNLVGITLFLFNAKRLYRS